LQKREVGQSHFVPELPEVESARVVIARIHDDGANPDPVRQATDAPQGIEQQSTAHALSLEAFIDRQLPWQ